jgi:hypothetical protein
MRYFSTEPADVDVYISWICDLFLFWWLVKTTLAKDSLKDQENIKSIQ